MTLLQRMADHDANEERRYLTDTRRRAYLAWSWCWLSWGFGVVAGGAPREEKGCALLLGPLCVEVIHDA